MKQSIHATGFFAPMALLGVILFAYAIGVLMAPYAPMIGSRLAEITCFQLAYTGERVDGVLAGFSVAERAGIVGLMIPGDMVFAFGYGFLLTGLLGLLTLRLPPAWQSTGRVLLWTPLLASVLDCLEDLGLHQMAAAPLGSDHGLVPLLTGIAATLKYLNLSVLAPAYGIGGSVKGITHDRRVGAWVIYALVILVSLAFMAKPLMEVPACF